MSVSYCRSVNLGFTQRQEGWEGWEVVMNTCNNNHSNKIQSAANSPANSIQMTVERATRTLTVANFLMIPPFLLWYVE